MMNKFYEQFDFIAVSFCNIFWNTKFEFDIDCGCI